MIDKQYGKYLLICDYCGESENEEFYYFNEAVKFKKQNNWKSVKTIKGWKDCCPKCREEV